MEEKDYKKEIVQTRIGCLGSSDGKMLSNISTLGNVPKSAYKRLAVCKGLIPQDEIPANAAMKAGDDIEMAVYQYLMDSRKDPRYESNPLWVSDKYSRKNVKLITHPDIVLKDDARKTLRVYEVKTTKYSFEDTRNEYKAQLYIHYLLGLEKAKALGKDWEVKVSLVHYSTDGLDLSNGIEFDVSRLTIKQVTFNAPVFNANRAMDIVDEFLEGFDEYYEGDDIDADLLPEKVKEEFDLVAATLVEIKERENMVDAFKKKLYQFMVDRDIKSIKNKSFSIVRVDPTESRSFDAKKYMDDMAKEHPRKAKKIMQEYTKVTNRKGYATIRVKEEK